LSRAGIDMLCRADVADVAMAAAADMFEMGVKVQVLKRGSLFSTRSQRLYALYRAHTGLEDIPANVRAELEKDVFREPIDAIWQRTRTYFMQAAPAEIERAERDSKHRMALVFRWYLFMSAQWAREGDQTRTSDYQIWCGPALGAFNTWVKGTFLETPAARTVAQIGLNLLEGAAVITRAQQLRAIGVDVPAAAFRFSPRRLNAGAA
jgi:PfaD family protein